MSRFVCLECGRLQEAAGFCSADGTPVVAREDELQGQLLGSYRVTRLIGRGGMGEVYQGVHPEIGSRVAIKVLGHDCLEHPEYVQRFFDEARAVNFIRHENIVNVLDLAYLADGRPYIVMEHLEGETLRALMSSRRTSFDVVVGVLGEVLTALAAAHAKGIVHRDLKPDNIMVTPAGHAKVLDFGIAKLRPELTGQRAATQMGSVLGTPLYMSPEQAMGGVVDERTDLYSMGVVLYEAITGRRPFEGKTLHELLQKHITDAPPPPSTLRLGVPVGLERVVLQALSKNPRLRFSSAAAFREALLRAAHESGLVAGSTGTAASADTPLGSQGSAAPSPPAVAAATTNQPPEAAGSGTVLATSPPPGGGPAGYASGGDAAGRYPGPGAGPHGGRGLVPETQAAGQRVPAPQGLPPTQGGAPAGYAAVPPHLAGGGYAGAWRSEKPRRASKAPLYLAIGCGGVALLVGTVMVGFWLWQMQRAITVASDAADIASENLGHAPVQPTEAEAAAPDEIPPLKKAPTPAGVELRQFDPTAYYPVALGLAQEVFPDALFLRLDAEGVRPDGTVDLKASEDNNVLYRFRSPAHSNPPPGFPENLTYEGPCLYYVHATGDGVNAFVVDNWACDAPTLSFPRCSSRQIWDKAVQRGAATGNVVGALGYWADDAGTGNWHLSIPPSFSMSVPDGC